MEPSTFRGKPSDSHVIWRRSGAGESVPKRFDERRLREWCSERGVDFETDRRVDHDRSDQPRKQYRCVFAWADEEWEIATRETPRTFLKIDDAGATRVKSWDEEYVLGVEELTLDGGAFVFRAAQFDGTKRLDARKLKARPD